MISQGDSPDQGAGVPVSVQSCIEQERRDCCRLFFLTAVCALTVTLALILKRCARQELNIHDPRYIEQIKATWSTNSTNSVAPNVAVPLPNHLPEEP